jgi:hypothetical protein
MSVSILDARVKLAAVLAPQTEDEPPVHNNPVDAVVAPCLIINWRIPMIDGWRACNAFGYLTVTLVGGRLDTEGGVEVIEQMYDTMQRRLRETSEGWTVQTDGGIGPYVIANVQYLACRVEVRIPIAV